uniref:Major facilitator superfamily (MFS) profile domain-containing protein n=1 Tax=Ciona savignyi TaxID=51511 RepID=H2YI38_CIOSA
MGCSSCIEKLKAFTESNTFVIVIVYASLMVDNMLLTAVVPILPEYFYQKHEQELESRSTHSTTATTETPMPATYVPRNDTICIHQAENDYLAKEPIYIGILFASKPVVQTLANFAVGPITDRIGFDIPLLAGYIIMAASAILFALGKQYGVLLLARAVQGVGSACAATAGMAWLADRYTDNAERGRAMGIALGGLALGVLTGPTFASVIYQLAGKDWVFITLAILALALVVVQLTTRKMKVFRRSDDNGTPIFTLLADPYILTVAVCVAVGNSVIGIVEAGQPIWMIKTMCPSKWELGIAFLPISATYLLTINLVAVIGHKVTRWIFCLLGFYCCVLGSVVYPFAHNVLEVIGPGAILGIGVGFVDSSMLPVMAFLVDKRHKPVYGSVYAITDIAFCVAFTIGPLISGGVITAIGFEWLMWGMAIALFIFAPIVCVLR